VDICPSLPCNVQKKKVIALDNERIATFLLIAEVPEDAISGTPSLSIMHALLIFCKVYAGYMLILYRKEKLPSN